MSSVFSLKIRSFTPNAASSDIVCVRSLPLYRPGVFLLGSSGLRWSASARALFRPCFNLALSSNTLLFFPTDGPVTERECTRRTPRTSQTLPYEQSAQAVKTLLG
jgi:hypothetical protein